MRLLHAVRQFGSLLREHRRGVLLCLLVVLHLTLLAGGKSVVGLMCWFVDVGLFILWQPFVQTERRLNYGICCSLPPPSLSVPGCTGGGC